MSVLICMKALGSRWLTILLVTGGLFLASASAVYAGEVTVTAHVPVTSTPLGQLLSISHDTSGMNLGAAEGSFLVTNRSEVPVLFRGIVASDGSDEGQAVPEQLLLPGKSTTIHFALSATSILGRVRPMLELTYPDGSSKVASVAPQLFLVSSAVGPAAAGGSVLLLVLALLFGEMRVFALRTKVRKLSAQLA